MSDTKRLKSTNHSAHAKRHLTQQAMDDQMARRGYAVGWHGTAGHWTKSVFGKPHGVPAFYLFVEHGPAESYAVLRSFDINEKPRVAKFYVSTSNVLTLQDDGGGAKPFVKVLQKAKADGYAVVQLLGALDDQYYRLGKHGKIIDPPAEKALDEAGPADEWVVLDPAVLVSAETARRRLASGKI